MLRSGGGTAGAVGDNDDGVGAWLIDSRDYRHSRIRCHDLSSTIPNTGLNGFDVIN